MAYDVALSIVSVSLCSSTYEMCARRVIVVNQKVSSPKIVTDRRMLTRNMNLVASCHSLIANSHCWVSSRHNHWLLWLLGGRWKIELFWLLSGCCAGVACSYSKSLCNCWACMGEAPTLRLKCPRFTSVMITGGKIVSTFVIFLKDGAISWILGSHGLPRSFKAVEATTFCF